MNEELLKAQDIILAKVDYICSKVGLNNVMAELYFILYFSHKPLSLDEMAERLNISKGSVSVNIRALERYGAVKRMWIGMHIPYNVHLLNSISLSGSDNLLYYARQISRGQPPVRLPPVLLPERYIRTLRTFPFGDLLRSLQRLSDGHPFA